MAGIKAIYLLFAFIIDNIWAKESDARPPTKLNTGLLLQGAWNVTVVYVSITKMHLEHYVL